MERDHQPNKGTSPLPERKKAEADSLPCRVGVKQIERDRQMYRRQRDRQKKRERERERVVADRQT